MDLKSEPDHLKRIPAFPYHHFDLADGEHGMTLRDYFAAKAMQTLLPDSDFRYVASEAYFMADAMMEARNGQ